MVSAHSESGAYAFSQYRFSDAEERTLLEVTAYDVRLTAEQMKMLTMLCEARYAGVMRAPR